MSKTKPRKWNSAEHLKNDEDMAAYLEACFAEAGDDPAFISKALGTISKANGMGQLAQDDALGKKQPPI
jgi:probable addiction module antidote protein